MLMILDTKEETEQFLQSIKKEIIVIPIMSDIQMHPNMNNLSVLYITFLDSEESYLIPVDHSESDKFIFDVPSNIHAYTLNAKISQQICNSYGWTWEDCQSMQYLIDGTIINQSEHYTQIQKSMYQKYHNYKHINKSVPLLQLGQHCDSLSIKLRELIQSSVPSKSYEFLSRIAIPVLADIESNGLSVNRDKLILHFGVGIDKFIDNSYMVYTDYNLYTTTGRTSNKYGGINFAALNKNDKTRESFISRFDDGLLVSIDFESYHLRLIADLIGYKLPKEPVHEYLGKQYYKVDSLTEEQYESGKAKTFAMLYGFNNDTDIPFFKKVYEYIDYLWELINKNGYITSPLYNRKIILSMIDNPSKSKIFNYMIQLTESEYSLSMLNELITNGYYWTILYTYDAILLDIPLSKINDIKDIVTIMEQNGKFPVRIYWGKDYNNLIKVRK